MSLIVGARCWRWGHRRSISRYKKLVSHTQRVVGALVSERRAKSRGACAHSASRQILVPMHATRCCHKYASVWPSSWLTALKHYHDDRAGQEQRPSEAKNKDASWQRRLSAAEPSRRRPGEDDTQNASRTVDDIHRGGVAGKPDRYRHDQVLGAEDQRAPQASTLRAIRGELTSCRKPTAGT